MFWIELMKDEYVEAFKTIQTCILKVSVLFKVKVINDGDLEPCYWLGLYAKAELFFQ